MAVLATATTHPVRAFIIVWKRSSPPNVENIAVCKEKMESSAEESIIAFAHFIAGLGMDLYTSSERIAIPRE